MEFVKPMVLLVLLAQVCSFEVHGQSAKIDSLQKALTVTEGEERVKGLNQLSSLLTYTDKTEAIRLAEEAIDLSQRLGYVAGMIAGNENIGMANRSDYAKKTDYLSRALALAEHSGDSESAVRLAINIAQTYSLPNNYEKSLEYYLRALEANKTLQNKKLEARALNGIGWVYKNSGKYTLAIESFAKALVLSEELKDEKTIPWTNLALASVYSEMGDSTSLKYFDLAYQHFQSQGEKSGMAVSLYRTGEVYLRRKSWLEASSYLNRALVLSESINQPTYVAISLKLLGEVLQNTNKKDKAIECFLRSESIGRKLKMREHLSEVYKNLAALYKEKNDFKNALLYNELYITYNDSLFSEAKNKQLVEMQTRYETENKEKEIEILKKDKVISRIYLVSVSFGLFFIVLTGFLIINRQRLKSRKDKELSRKEMQIFEEHMSLTEVELQNKILREKHLENELEFKNKELTTFTLNLIQKNEILEDLKAQIASIRTSSDDTTKSSLSGLMSTVNRSFRNDKDWDNFKLHFQQVHKDFFESLGKAYSDLSGNDLKVCAMLKLNIGTKEMASILDISPESVKAARYRIRKKIGLPSEQSLSSFFNNFPNS